MNTSQKLVRYSVNFFCWLVKAAGLALLGLILAIFIGEGPPNPLKLSPRELLLFLSLLVSLGGIIFAMWNQLIGGVAVVAGMVLFVGESVQWVFLAFILIGVLNIVCWFARKLIGGK